MTPPRPKPSGAGDPPRSRGRATTVSQAEDEIAVAAAAGRASDGPRFAVEEAVGGGPPWPAAPSVTGSAHGASLNPPHRRHTIAGTRHGQIRDNNTVYLRGYQDAPAGDVPAIAAGQARGNPDTQVYEINGRSYGVEPNGTVYPVSGVGMVKLDRNGYAALKEIVRAVGGAAAEQEPPLPRES